MGKLKTLNGMAIVIPTYGRPSKQITLRETPRDLHPFTYLACVKGEAEVLGGGDHSIIVQPARVKQIHQKRQWIMDWAHENGVKKVLMLDDDMFWQARGPKGLVKEYATDGHVFAVLNQMSAILDEFGHAGFSSRMGNNRVESDFARTTRMMHSLGYNVKAFRASGASFDRVHGKEDFDVTLQMMARGWDNVVVYHTCVSPGSYDAPGGCSLERTLESANRAAESLQKLHPDHVRVVEKAFKNHPRKEVQMSWKKCFARGVSLYGEQRLKPGTLYDGLPRGSKT